MQRVENSLSDSATFTRRRWNEQTAYHLARDKVFGFVDCVLRSAKVSAGCMSVCVNSGGTIVIINAKYCGSERQNSSKLLVLHVPPHPEHVSFDATHRPHMIRIQHTFPTKHTSAAFTCTLAIRHNTCRLEIWPFLAARERGVLYMHTSVYTAMPVTWNQRKQFSKEKLSHCRPILKTVALLKCTWNLRKTRTWWSYPIGLITKRQRKWAKSQHRGHYDHINDSRLCQHNIHFWRLCWLQLRSTLPQ